MPIKWQIVRFTGATDPSFESNWGLNSLCFERSQVIFERGCAGSWDEFGVRDPALLVDTKGNLVRDEGAMIIYYTGSHNGGRWQASGRAVSHDEGLTWHREPERPVLAPRNNAWDSGVASTPWVIRDDDGLYRLYYRGARTIYRDAIGLATSHDGINFTRFGDKPILIPDDFTDMAKKGKQLMGVTNVVHTLDGRYLLTFEGWSVSHDATQIFAAISEDGYHFSPLNNGCPFFSADQVQSWFVRRVANPRITVLENPGLYILTFNACSDSGLHAIGMAFTRDFKEWWEHPNNPLIHPSGKPLDDPFSGRLEGGVLIKEDLEEKTEPIRMFLMAIPRRGPSHKNSVIGLAKGWTQKPEGLFSFRVVLSQSTDVRLSPGNKHEVETICLQQSANSAFPPRIHFNLQACDIFCGVQLTFYLEPDHPGSVFIILGDDMGTVIRGDGIRLGFNKGHCYLWRGWPGKNLRERLKFGQIRRVLERWGLPERWPWFFWKSLGSCEHGTWKTVTIELTEKRWTITLDGQVRASFRDTGRVTIPFTDLAIQSDHQPIRIRDLRIRYDHPSGSN